MRQKGTEKDRTVGKNRIEGQRTDRNRRRWTENVQEEILRDSVMELLGNPTFKNHIKCAPERKYEDAERKIRVFDEMWTVDWWWDTQVLLTLLEISRCLPGCHCVRKNCQLV